MANQSTSSLIPLALLVFGQSDKPGEALPQLGPEQAGISSTLRGSNYCGHRPLTPPTDEELKKELGKYGPQIQILHVGGHGASDRLWLQDEAGKLQTTYVRGLAKLIEKQLPIQLVFLNACATKDQMEVFTEKGVKVVIATAGPVYDEVACLFATAFYKAWVAGGTLREAFDEAQEELERKKDVDQLYPSPQTRDRITRRGLDPQQPYLLHLHANHPQADQVTLKDLCEAMEPAKGGRVGTEAYLMVDRSQELSKIRKYYRQRGSQEPHFPAAFVLQGIDEDQSRRFSERLFTFVEEMEYVLGKPLGRAPEVYHISLPNQSSFKASPPDDLYSEARLEIEASWRKSLGLPPSQHLLTTQDLLNRWAASPANVLMLEHTLWAKDWCAQMEAYLKEYLGACLSFALTKGQPEIILLIHVVYESLDGVKGWFDNSKKVEKKLLALSQYSPMQGRMMLLDRLQSLKPDDVRRWRATHLPHQAPIAGELFGQKKALPIGKVMDFLKDVIQRHNAQFT